MAINQFAGLDKKFLKEIAQEWEQNYFTNHSTSNWKGYIQIMNYLNQMNQIPPVIKANLTALAVMDEEAL
jgi:tRNA A37 N6-isopentenylltransferase MiaA